jgi:hypothetical protein
MRSGVAAEYGSVDALVDAIRAVRARGVTRLEAYSSVPSDKIDAALGARRSPLAIAAGIGGLVGAAGGYVLQWFLVAYLYPVDVGSRPPHMPLPFTIITIEMGFLLGAITVFVAFLIGAKLLKLWEPLFEVPGFESATRAGFWLAIDARDHAWNRAVIVEALHGAGASRVHGFGGLG